MHTPKAALLASLALLACNPSRPASPAHTVVLRPVEDAFVDAFGLDRPMLPVKMPFNIGDETWFAASRVDHFGGVLAAWEAHGGQPWSTDEAMAAFYDNQATANADPSRDRAVREGLVVEQIDDDGTSRVTVSLIYRDLPLAVYTAASFDEMLRPGGPHDPTKLVKVLGDGRADASLFMAMRLPHPGAELAFWQAADEDRIEAFQYRATGRGTLTGLEGFPAGAEAVVEISELQKADGTLDTRIAVLPVPVP